MGSSKSQPTSKQNYTPPQEMDPAVKQFLQNLNMFTNTVCQQPQQPSGSGPNVNPNTVVFYPVDQQQGEYNTYSCQNPNSQNPYAQNPYAQSPYSDQPDSILVFQTENYENSKDSLNYGTIKDCWKKQDRYTL